jgi:hypothetical protein
MLEGDLQIFAARLAETPGRRLTRFLECGRRPTPTSALSC